MATGGDIRELRWTHPTLGQGVFYPKAAESNTLDPGGFRTTDEANGIDGSGTPIYTINQNRGFAEVVCSNDMNGTNELAVAAALSADPLPAEWVISVSNGAVWGITGKPVGDLQTDVNASTFTLKVSGGPMKKL